MSTRSYVGVLNRETNNVRLIYVHFDGYFEGVGEALLTKFHSEELINPIIELGDRSSLDENSFAGDGESYKEKGEEETGAIDIDFGKILDVAKRGGIEYVYVLDGEHWRFFDVFHKEEYNPYLEEVVDS